MKFPNFLIIGAQKAGTTSLYYYLKQHPEIFMLDEKEPRFFALMGSDLDYRGPDDPSAKCEYISFSSYKKLFKKVKGEKAVGECSTLYLYSLEAPGNIKKNIPDVKIIAVLRNPIERAYSNYVYAYQNGHETIDLFSKALREEEIRIEEKWGPLWHYKSKGFYTEQLKRYYELFSPNQILIFLYDDLKEQPVSVCQKIFRFLNVDDTFVPDISYRYNVTGIPKIKWLHRFIRDPSRLKFFYLPIPSKIRNYIKKGINQLNISNKQKLKLEFTSEDRKYLKAIYNDEIKSLEKLFNKDLSNWLYE
ncbi:MAG: sulfotransferase [Actinobacteria bacterium]|nr:sulfotransferase [Actinomycetota bacterium]